MGGQVAGVPLDKVVQRLAGGVIPAESRQQVELPGVSVRERRIDPAGRLHEQEHDLTIGVGQAGLGGPGVVAAQVDQPCRRIQRPSRGLGGYDHHSSRGQGKRNSHMCTPDKNAVRHRIARSRTEATREAASGVAASTNRRGSWDGCRGWLAGLSYRSESLVDRPT